MGTAGETGMGSHAEARSRADALAAAIGPVLAAAAACRDGFRAWRAGSSDAAGVVISWRFAPAAPAPELYLALDTPLDVATVAGLVLEPDLSGLAGTLLRFDRKVLGPGSRQLGYRGRLPWPLSPRAFGVVQRFAVDSDGTFWLATSDAPEAAPAEPGDVVGEIRCSSYRIAARPGGGAHFARLQSVVLGLPFARAWLAPLRRYQLVDAGILRAPVAHAAALRERIAGEPMLAL